MEKKKHSSFLGMDELLSVSQPLLAVKGSSEGLI